VAVTPSGAGLTGLILALGLLAAACSSDDPNPTSTASPLATARATEVPSPPTAAPLLAPTPTPAPPVSADFRDFAEQIDAALKRGDIDFFSERLSTETPLSLAFASTDRGGEVTADVFLAAIERLWTDLRSDATDGYGDSTPDVYAVSFSHSGRLESELVQAAVLTSITEAPADFNRSEPVRATIVTLWVMDADDWRVFSILDATVTHDDFLDPTDEGRGRMPSWERFQP
jgi:hypothetical protein